MSARRRKDTARWVGLGVAVVLVVFTLWLGNMAREQDDRICQQTAGYVVSPFFAGPPCIFDREEFKKDRPEFVYKDYSRGV